MIGLGALSRLLVCGAASLLAGCSGDLKLEDLTTSGLSELPKTMSTFAPTAYKAPVGSATEVYTRVARGVLTCWMGAHGSLKGTHLFQAEAEPRTKGGAAQINIHERIKGSPNKRGRKAFSVSITPVSEGASVTSENIAFPKAQGESMRGDIDRWAAAEEGCLKTPITEGWSTPAETTKIPPKGGSKKQPSKPTAKPG